MFDGKHKLEVIYDNVRHQSKWPENKTSGTLIKVELSEFDWPIVLALLAQELGIQSMIEVKLREESSAGR